MQLRTLRRKTGVGVAFDDVLQFGTTVRRFAGLNYKLPEEATVIFRSNSGVEYELTEWKDVPLVYEQNPSRESV